MPAFASGSPVKAAALNRLSGVFLGQTSVTFASAGSFVGTVTFGVTLPHAPTHVSVNIASASGTVAQWVVRADSFTTTSFRLIATGPTQAWSGVTVTYAAFYDPSP